MPVLDANVLIAEAIHHDTNHPAASAWIRRQVAEGRQSLLAPVILLAEVAGAVRRATGSEMDAQRAVDKILGSGLVQLVPLDLGLAEGSARLAAAAQLRGCDAIYAALAASLDDLLVTFDRQLAERAAMFVPVEIPRA